jgi:hypothetical protein
MDRLLTALYAPNSGNPLLVDSKDHDIFASGSTAGYYLGIEVPE